jgi:hypothetical protein
MQGVDAKRMSFSHNVNSLSSHPFLARFCLTLAVTLILTESRPLSFTKINMVGAAIELQKYQRL